VRNWIRILFLIMLCSCVSEPIKEGEVNRSFGEDLALLQEYTDVVVLKDSAGDVQVAVVPAWQGRVMTSTSGGLEGPGFGWINTEMIRSPVLRPHINAFGGEDRFWMGPEGGQFAIFFRKGAPFDLQNWQTPAFIDTEKYRVVNRTDTEVQFEHQAEVENYSGTVFQLKIERTVRLLGRDRVRKQLGPEVESLQIVAFESENRVFNTGRAPWVEEKGLLSIWILGMYNPTPETTIVIPFREGPEEDLGPIVNDAYFGKIPPDRLRIGKGVLFFKGDGKSRGKIGLSPERARPFLGSWDAVKQVLTVVHFNLPVESSRYVNSMWEIQEDPYDGDVVNSYNDGPPEPGAKPLGPFYELETSSPALALEPGKSYTHFHHTVHLSGDLRALDRAAESIFGVGIEVIESAFRVQH